MDDLTPLFLPIAWYEATLQELTAAYDRLPFRDPERGPLSREIVTIRVKLDEVKKELAEAAQRHMAPAFDRVMARILTISGDLRTVLRELEDFGHQLRNHGGRPPPLPSALRETAVLIQCVILTNRGQR